MACRISPPFAQRLIRAPKWSISSARADISLRPSLSVRQIGEVVRAVKAVKPDVIVMVDNCYGEFVEESEPLSVGADLIAGSRIKNPGGGIAPTGGYIAGRADLIQLCSYRMTTPGLGREVGRRSARTARSIWAVPCSACNGEALKSAAFTAALFERLGYDVTPRCGETRHDIIQAVLLREEKALIAFCQGMQKGAPVDLFVSPEPWDMPGYDSKVIMAAERLRSVRLLSCRRTHRCASHLPPGCRAGSISTAQKWAYCSLRRR